MTRLSGIAECGNTFMEWFGDEYDVDVMHATLAVAAGARLEGDPAWLLVISGPGAAKTETIQTLSAVGAIVTSTIASEGALLSGTSRKEKAKDATGGLLRQIGSSGILVLKDATSILAMHRDTRATLLAAFREVYDGRWQRNVGMDGGRTLTWTGRIVVIGACTSEWDRAHDVVAKMGDRFVLVRMDSTQAKGRIAAGLKALANTGEETKMREQLARAVARVLDQVEAHTAIRPTVAEADQLLAAANVVTLCRTAVQYDYRGGIEDAHEPEMPTRFLKQLLQVMRGGCAIGLDREKSLQLAIRCARDSMPPLRLAILDDLAANPHARCREVRQRLNKPYSTVDRQLQALHMLGVLDCDEVPGPDSTKSSWYYSVSDVIDPGSIRVPEMSVEG
jgi:hypothetical protein